MNRIEELEKELKLLREIEELKNKPKFEVGKWYKSKNEYPVFLTELRKDGWAYCYGFDCDNGWIDENIDGIRSQTCLSNFHREATNDEVQTALIKETEKRGFKEGVRFGSLISNRTIDTNAKGYTFDGVGLFSCCGSFVFNDGKWATIIDTPLTINGKTVTIGKEFVSIGCKTLEHKAFKQFVSDLTFFNITDFNHPEVGNVTTKQFQEIVDKIE